MTPTTKAQITYKAMTRLADTADTLTRIPRIGYHAAAPVHRLAVALMPAYRRWLRQAAHQAAAELEHAHHCTPLWADKDER